MEVRSRWLIALPYIAFICILNLVVLIGAVHAGAQKQSGRDSLPRYGALRSSLSERNETPLVISTPAHAEVLTSTTVTSPTSTPTLTPIIGCTLPTSTPYPTATHYATQPPTLCFGLPTEPPSSTPTPHPCPQCPTSTLTPTATPTISNVCTPQPTYTPNPTYTPRPTMTRRPSTTPCPPTITPTRQPTHTRTPTYTPTTGAGTATSVPATLTSVPSTATSVSPTSTLAATQTRTPAMATRTGCTWNGGCPTWPAATRTATSTPVPATATACTITFIDVPVTDPFYANIRCLACRGIIGGYADGTFRPNNNITRGQIAKVVANAAGFSEPVTGQRYADVLPTNTFYEWIERLSQRGYMGGYPCGLRTTEPCQPPENRPYFRPFENATRGQLSKIVANVAGFQEPVSGQFYADVDSINPFYLEIMRLTNRGVMSGYPCGSPGEPCDPQNRPYFRWGNAVTRGQASKIGANTFYPNCQTPR
jgi:hypothetical protein